MEPGSWHTHARKAVVWLQDRGIAVDPSPFGCGAYGCVYEVQNDADKVLKLTSDGREGAAAKHRMTLRDVHGAARVFAVIEIPGSPLVAILQEKLHPLSEQEYGALARLLPGAVRELAKDFPQHIFHGEAVDLLDEVERRLGKAARIHLTHLAGAWAAFERAGIPVDSFTVVDVLKDRFGRWKVVDFGEHGGLPDSDLPVHRG